MSSATAESMRKNLEMNVQAGLDPYFYLLEQPDPREVQSKIQQEEEQWSKVMRVIISHCTEYAQNVKKKMEEMDNNLYDKVAKVKIGDWINGKWTHSTMNFKKYNKQQLEEFNKTYCDIGMVLKPIYPFITTTFDPEDTTLVTLFPFFSDINTLREALFSLYEILELRKKLCHNTTGRLTKKQFSVNKDLLIASITSINAFLNTTEKAEQIVLDCMSDPFTPAEYSSTLLAAYYISSRILEECRS